MKSQDKSMTCEKFFFRHFEDSFDELADEMFWERSFKTDTVFDCMTDKAKNLGINLTDKESWDYDTFLYDAYQCTEKGLS